MWRTQTVITEYKTISPEMRAAISTMSAAARRLNSVFSSSYVTEASLSAVNSLSDELEAANRKIRKLAHAG